MPEKDGVWMTRFERIKVAPDGQAGLGDIPKVPDTVMSGIMAMLVQVFLISRQRTDS